MCYDHCVSHRALSPVVQRLYGRLYVSACECVCLYAVGFVHVWLCGVCGDESVRVSE